MDVYPPDNSDPWGGNDDDPWGGNDPWDDDSYDKDYWENIGDGEGDTGGVPWSGGTGSNGNNSDPVQQLLNKMKFDTDISQEFKERFKDSLNKIKNIDIGKKLIDRLIAKSGDIRITDNDNHSVQGNILNIGIFNDDPKGLVINYQETSLAHELFHLLQNVEYGTTQREISFEVEARLFEFRIAKSLGQETVDLFFRTLNDGVYEDDFKDFATGDSFSVEEFNRLIDGFKNASQSGSTYDNYRETHITSLNDIIIDDILK